MTPSLAYILGETDDPAPEPYQLHLGDCLEVLKTLPDNSVDGIVTDPPAGISFMGKSWDSHKGGRSQWVAWMTDVASECLRVVKPGGHALVWALPRTSHWTATAWEDAGFEIRDRISHCFGSGFPKAADVSTNLDRMVGAEREVVGKRKHPTLKDTTKIEEMANAAHGENSWAREWDLTAPATDMAKLYSGYKTALKPAMEDWWLCRKPLEGTVAANVLKHGTGALNIDGCRVATDDNLNGGATTSDSAVLAIDGFDRPWMHDEEKLKAFQDRMKAKVEHAQAQGRFPANIIHDNSEQVLACFPDSKGQLADVSHTAPSSKTSNVYGSMKREGEPSADSENEGAVGFKMKPGARRKDTGSAARFFKACPDTDPEDDEARRLIYCAKASKKDRNEGVKQNKHPTVKPVTLMRYLCRMISPPGDAVILDPFLGSGSTGKACMLEGIRFIGIEREEEYMQIARARIAHAAQSLVS